MTSKLPSASCQPLADSKPGTAYEFHVDIQIKEGLDVSPGSWDILPSKFSGADSRYCRAENPRTHSLPGSVHMAIAAQQAAASSYSLRLWRDQRAELDPRGVQELECLSYCKVIRNRESATKRKHRRRGNLHGRKWIASTWADGRYGVNQRLQVVYPRTDLTSVEDLTGQGNWGTTAVAEVLAQNGASAMVKSHRMESAKANHEKRPGPEKTQWKGRNSKHGLAPSAWNGSKLLHIQAGRGFHEAVTALAPKMAVNNATAMRAQAGAKILYSNLRTRGVIESAIRGRQQQDVPKLSANRDGQADSWRTIKVKSRPRYLDRQRSDRSFSIAHAVVLAAQWVVVKLLGNGYGGNG
ncbi:hypothetical protein M752DRAFT_287456 [Aspergillus phoenicis ATCC 13157]|uniref:Uncharacterized protein n=1 Tax=Aspergillus phoenicis ATCC 13157 TaxID=1353007 RepID=A0A370P4Z5_ASPPH|nr:hypothetical protein M752DRAFT_287456 [Aspergillus phoenicis ATCC 13157]